MLLRGKKWWNKRLRNKISRYIIRLRNFRLRWIDLKLRIRKIRKNEYVIR